MGTGTQAGIRHSSYPEDLTVLWGKELREKQVRENKHPTGNMLKTFSVFIFAPSFQPTLLL